MSEQDGAWVGGIDDAAGDDGDAGFAPVLGVHAPHDGGVAELGEHQLTDALIDRAIRWSDGLRAIACGFKNGVGGHSELAADLLV